MTEDELVEAFCGDLWSGVGIRGDYLGDRQVNP
jgi:hypothetical protein